MFFHPSRTGGSAIDIAMNRFAKYPIRIFTENQFLDSVYTNSHDKHWRIPKYIFNGDITYQDLDDYYKFTIVRNPWERALSMYFYSNRTTKFDKDLFIKTLGLQTSCFSAFVDVHGLPNEKQFNYIIRNETMQEDFDNVCEEIGVRKKKLMPDIGSTHHKHYTEYYDEELIKYIEVMYYHDISKFGYKYGD